MDWIPKRQVASELLDGESLDTHELVTNLADLRALNHWLGGNSLILRHLERLFNPSPLPRCFSLLDVGTGSADLPVVVRVWAGEQGSEVQALGGDVHSQVLAVARGYTQSKNIPVQLLRCNGLRLPLTDAGIDVVCSSLVLHHFDTGPAAELLAEMCRVARYGVIVSDLTRSWPGYLGFTLLSWLMFRGNGHRMTANDGPLSFLRAYTPAELRWLAQAARLPAWRIYSYPALFRQVLVVQKRTANN